MMKKAIIIIAVISALTLLILTMYRKPYLSFTERSLLKNCKVDRTNTALNEKAIEKVESLASYVKMWVSREEEETSIFENEFPWDDVALSMLSYPDSVKFSNKTCDRCRKQTLVHIYFRSPSSTWRNMCGRAGHMTICTDCKKQVEYSPTMMN